MTQYSCEHCRRLHQQIVDEITRLEKQQADDERSKKLKRYRNPHSSDIEKIRKLKIDNLKEVLQISDRIAEDIES